MAEQSSRMWFCRIGGVERGPFTREQIKSLVSRGKLTPDDELRSADDQKWRTAGSIKGLFDAPVEDEPAPRRAKKKSSPGKSSRQSKKKGLSPLLVGLAGTATVVVVGTVLWLTGILGGGEENAAVVASAVNGADAPSADIAVPTISPSQEAEAEALVAQLEKQGAVVSRTDQGKTEYLSYLPQSAPGAARQEPEEGHLNDESFALLANLPELFSLTVLSEKMTGQSLTAVAKMPKLNSLWLMKVPVADADLATLKDARQLRRLAINFSDRLTDACFAQLRQMPWIESFDFAQTRVTEQGQKAFREGKVISVQAATKQMVPGMMFAPQKDTGRLKPLANFSELTDASDVKFFHDDNYAYLLNHAGHKIWNVVSKTPYGDNLRCPVDGLFAMHPTKMIVAGMQPKPLPNSTRRGNAIFVWDLAADALVWETPAFDPLVLPMAVEFSPTGGEIAIALRDYTGTPGKPAAEVRVLSATTGDMLLTKPIDNGNLFRLAFSPNGSQLALPISTDNSQTLALMNVVDGSISWEVPTTGAQKRAFHATGTVIACDSRPESGPTSVAFLDVATGMTVSTLPVENLSDFTMSFDGKRIAVARFGETHAHIDVFDADRNIVASLVSTTPNRGDTFSKLKIEFGQSTYRLGISAKNPTQLEFWDFVAE